MTRRWSDNDFSEEYDMEKKRLTPEERQTFLDRARAAVDAGRVEYANPDGKEALASIGKTSKSSDELFENPDFISVRVEIYNETLRIQWAARGLGFGELEYWKDDDGDWRSSYETGTIPHGFAVKAFDFWLKQVFVPAEGGLSEYRKSTRGPKDP